MTSDQNGNLAVDYAMGSGLMANQSLILGNMSEIRDNQAGIARALSDAGAALNPGPLHAPEFAQKLQTNLAQALSKLDVMSNRAADICDGDGAVRVVAAGDSLLSPSVTRRLIQAFADGPAPAEHDPALDLLTDREREVLGLLATGRSNAEIADVLIVGEATVKTHVSRVFDKLGVRDRVQAVVWAHEHGVT